MEREGRTWGRKGLRQKTWAGVSEEIKITRERRKEKQDGVWVERKTLEGRRRYHKTLQGSAEDQEGACLSSVSLMTFLLPWC